jgi:hypothetical protein
MLLILLNQRPRGALALWSASALASSNTAAVPQGYILGVTSAVTAPLRNRTVAYGLL